MPILKWQVSSSSDFALFFVVMTNNYSINFKLIHFILWMKGLILSQFWDFRVLWWKLAKFLLSYSKLQVTYSPNFGSLFSVTKDNSSILFRSSVMYFAQKEPIKVQIFETFECLGQNSPNLCRFWNKKSVFLQIMSWDINPLYIFSWNFIYFQQKEPIKVQI